MDYETDFGLWLENASSTLVTINSEITKNLCFVILTLFFCSFTAPVSAETYSSDMAARTAAKDFTRQGDLFFNKGNSKEATRLYKKALYIFDELDADYQSAVVRHKLAFTYTGSGEHQLAIPLFEANIQFHKQRNDDSSTVNYLLYAAQSYQKLGNPSKAIAYLADAMKHRISDDSKKAEIIALQSTLLENEGRIDEALALLVSAYRTLPLSIWQGQLAIEFNHLSEMVENPPSLDKDSDTAFPLWIALGLMILVVSVIVTTTFLRRWIPEIVLATSSILISLLLAELFLRYMYPEQRQIKYFLHHPNQVTVFHPRAELMPGVDYAETRFTTNHIGLRGDNLPSGNVFRILAVGGSSTEALFLDDADAWPLRMQERLSTLSGSRIWVGNAGKSGLNSFSHVSQVYQSGREINPDLILITAGINDLNQCISGGRSSIRDNHIAFKSPSYVAKYSQHVFAHIETKTGQESEGLRLIKFAERLWTSITEKPAEEIQFDYVIQDDAGLFYYEQRKRRQAAIKVDKLPDITECLDAYEANLNHIVRISNDLNIPLVLVTQGSMYRQSMQQQELELLWFGSVDENPFSEKPPGYYYTADVMQSLLKQYNERTLKVCREQGLKCWDMDTNLAKTTATYYDDVHLNVSGSHALGDKLADFLFTDVIDQDAL